MPTICIAQNRWAQPTLQNLFEPGPNLKFAVLRVDWTADERIRIVCLLESFWDFGFVNGVQDLAD